MQKNFTNAYSVYWEFDPLRNLKKCLRVYSIIIKYYQKYNKH